MYDPTESHSTSEDYSPWSLLPAPEPRTVSPPWGYFYDNVVKHLVKDTVRIMHNGLPIDLNRVEELELKLDTLLADVHSKLADHPYIQQYLKQRHAKLISEYIADRQSHLKPISEFVKPFKYSDLTHRSYFMHIYSLQQGLSPPSELLPTGVPKYSANLVKKLSSTSPLLQKLLAGTLPPTHSIAIEAMQLLATHKCDLSNRKFLEQIATPLVDLPAFNPNSPPQKLELFTMLGLESDKLSKDTGAPSWDRDQIERVNKETTDPLIKDLTQLFIDFSFGAIVRNNFIEAFYKYTVNDRLHGQYRLFGAKSFRYTSSNPNMLNAPSSKSRFSKPIKKCFVAPPGFIVAGIDYSALEDRVIANLTQDKNKIILQTDTSLDGHLFHATIYFRKQFEAMFGPLPHKELAIAAKQALDAGNTEVKKYRDLSKNVTFGASYGAFPPKIASTIKCTLPEAEEIFNAYHNDMYPSITDYRENYVLPTALKQGQLHLGLGCYIKSDNPSRDLRTLHNASAQFWSILTVLAINKLHHLIDLNGLQNDIQVTATIYDSIYFCVREDPTIIKWLNDVLVPIMQQDFLPNQTVKNIAALDIGYDWASLKTISNYANEDEITNTLEEVRLLSHD